MPIVAMAADDGKEWGRGEHARRADYEAFREEQEMKDRIEPRYHGIIEEDPIIDEDRTIEEDRSIVENRDLEVSNQRQENRDQNIREGLESIERAKPERNW